MQTLEPPVEETERLLIHEEKIGINQIIAQAESRAAILNNLQPLTKSEIESITLSLSSIDAYILKKQLSENEELARLHKAGIKATADLPVHLQTLSSHLKGWQDYKMQYRNGDKFQNLVFNHAWQVDNESLASLFIRHKLKIYIEGEDLEKYRKVEQLISLLKFFEVPWQHIASSSAFSRIIEANGQEIKVRWQFFSR